MSQLREEAYIPFDPALPSSVKVQGAWSLPVVSECNCEDKSMTIKDVLLPLTSYPTPTQKRAIENAVALAESFGALVSAVAFEVDVQSPIGLYADPVGISGILAADRKKSAYNARDLLANFETIATARAVAHDHCLLQCRLLEIPGRLVDEARFCDLAMVPLQEAVAAELDIAEKLVFESGRPILVFPDDSKRELPASLKNVAVGWDFSRPATRAIADALPLLQRAKQVRVFTVVDDKPIDKSQSIAKLARHLARHGLEIVFEDVKSNGRAIGDVFKAYVSQHEIDLLVMGAYGHSRVREFILGGATRSILNRPPTWVLLSH
jgi:nucleotide-binding universal stress UspA family protein